MAGSTPNYSFNLPAVDGDEDIWGDLLNSNWSSADYELNVLSVSIGDLDARVGTAETDISGLTTRVGTAETDISGLTTRVGTAETDISDLTGRVGTAETDISGLTTRVGTAETDISDLQSDKAPLTGADFADMPQVGGSPIVESGSNSDGEWTRWADGTQVVSGTGELEYISGYYLGRVVVYPLGYLALPCCVFTINHASVTVGTASWGPIMKISSSSTGISFRLYVNEVGPDRFSPGDQVNFNYMAFGRWK